MPQSQPLLLRTALTAKELLIPWLITAALMIGFDYVQPMYPNELAQALLRVGKLFATAGFAYAVWTTIIGNTGEALITRYALRSGRLFLHYFIVNLAVNILGSTLLSLFGTLGGPTAIVATILLATIQHVVTVYALVSLVEKDFLEALMAIPALFRRTLPWAVALALVNPGMTLAGSKLLAGLDEQTVFTGAAAIGTLQILLTLFLIMGLLHARLDLETDNAENRTGEV